MTFSSIEKSFAFKNLLYVSVSSDPKNGYDRGVIRRFFLINSSSIFTFLLIKKPTFLLRLSPNIPELSPCANALWSGELLRPTPTLQERRQTGQPPFKRGHGPREGGQELGRWIHLERVLSDKWSLTYFRSVSMFKEHRDWCGHL